MDDTEKETDKEMLPEKPIFDKNMPYQDFLKTIPIEELEASKKNEFDKNMSYQDFLKTIPPKEKYTWTEMNEMVEREMRSIVGKMTDAIKEDIVGTLGVEDGVLNIFNTYLIKVLQSIVNDYKFKSGYKEHSKYVRDYLQIATGKIDTYKFASLRHQSPPTPNWLLSWVFQIIHDVPEYTELKKKYDKVYEYQFIGKSIEQIGYLLNMMANQYLTGSTYLNTSNYQEDQNMKNYLRTDPIVPLEHFGIFAGQNSGYHLKCKTLFYNTDNGKINKPFLKRFLEIFRDFYSFLIDEIDYDLPVKIGGRQVKTGKSMKHRTRRQRNKKSRKYKK